MKKTSFILAVVLFLVMALDASAQFMGATSRSRNYVSPDGYTAFWLGYSPASFNTGGLSMSGFNLFSLGISSATPLAGSSFLVELGGYAEWLNKTTKDGKDKTSFNVVGVKVPFNLEYPFALADGITVYPYAGLNARAFIFGQISDTYGDKTESESVFEGEDGMKRFNLGYQVGIRARISNVLIGIGYEDMLTSLSDELTIKVNGVVLSVGFPF